MDSSSTLLDALKKVSNPRSKSYGKYLTLDQIITLMNPSNTLSNRQDRVISWLRKASDEICPIVPRVSRLGDIITVSLSASQISKLFNASTYVYRHHRTQKLMYVSTVRSQTLEIPSDVAKDISFVSGLHLQPLSPSPAAPTPTPPSPPVDVLKISTVENRDRAFQVHLSLNLTQINENSSIIIKSFHGIATPTRGSRNDYLQPVHLTAPFQERVCVRKNSELLSCIVRDVFSNLLTDLIENTHTTTTTSGTIRTLTSSCELRSDESCRSCRVCERKFHALRFL